MSPLGFKHSPESRAKMSAACVGRKHSPASRKKMSVSKMGHETTPETRAKISAAISGEKNYSWKGGRRLASGGYISILMPEHPFATCQGYVLEHRLIVEKAIGRYLKPSEVVHHVNKDGRDNRNENLVACQDDNYHKLLHRRAHVAPAK